MNYERRTFVGDIEFRSEGSALRAVGYAARFDALSQNLGGYVERIAPGTFRKTLQEADIRALFNHDPNMVLGRNRSGTLRLEEDSDGLRYEIDLPDTRTGQEVATLLERGDVSGSSFGFRMIDEEWGETEDGFPVRTLKQVALRDVGPVTFPAYSDAESALRSFAESRSLALPDLLEAAAHNRLSEYIGEGRSEGEQEKEEERKEDGRENPTAHPARFLGLLS